MNEEEVFYSSIVDMSKLIRRKEISPTELTQAHLDRIKEIDSKLLSFITIMEEEALASANQSERELSEGIDRGPLHGIPIGLKDLFYTKGVRTTAGSKILTDFVPDHNATVVDKLREAGAVVLGKLNMHEFAFGGIPGNPHYGTVKNPWDLERFAGSSSGGSGAAVIAGLVAGALGTDTGGSIRTPATVCGIVGLKPTNGLVSNYGVFPNSRSLDTVGPMTRTVEDNALMLKTISGYDPLDDRSVKTTIIQPQLSIRSGLKGVRLGIIQNHYLDNVSSDVYDALYTAVAAMEKNGANVTEVTIPSLECCNDCYRQISAKEGAEVHRDWLESKRSCEYGPHVLEILKRGMEISDQDYAQAQQAQARVVGEFQAILREVDVLITPTYPTVTYRIDDEAAEIDGKVIPLSWITGRMTIAANLAGIPALSLPMGFSKNPPVGLPLGLQLMGRPFEEDLIYRTAYTYEQIYRWHQNHPSL